ncbi:hypothetical protein EDC65_2449 [Stella humosa]|uniref:Uncharacterized protein n=1 Tax=Stella humosa TaxID=94 RepID=A0A3N1LGH3_9PROT|nr:hypothetical protein [Stella humosa]ROP90597.1 hypothetical protein EDC65_2449 [Stella humosa]BBK29507.1 hypothetical protein STHU_01410 [Stella humosa]
MTDATPPAGRGPHPLVLALAAFTVWASAFTLLYVVQAIGCAEVWPPLLHQGAMTGVWVAHLVANALLLAVAWQGRAGAMAAVGPAAAAAALASTAWTGLPLFLASACV